MNKKTVLSLFACAILGAAMINEVQAQNAPENTNAAAGRGAGRGGHRRRICSRVRRCLPGPPAPVPPEVAIARPTVEEVAKMNDDLKKIYF